MTVVRRLPVNRISIKQVIAKVTLTQRRKTHRNSFIPSIKFVSILLLAVLATVSLRFIGDDQGSHLEGNVVTKPVPADASIQNQSDLLSSNCWLKDAYNRGDFNIFSHRSFVNANIETQPTCQEALQQLRDIGFSHLDLDLVFGVMKESSDPQLVVSQPMEFEHTSDYYSPCSLTPLDQIIPLLDQEFGDHQWFISLEPKAFWGRTQTEIEDPALAAPIDIMSILLDVVLKKKLTQKQCGIIVDSNALQDKEEKDLLRQLKEHCQLFLGIRRTDPVREKLMIEGFLYDSLMPTIEFHPNHPHNKEAITVSDEIAKKSIFWIVDNKDDLRLAADLHAQGIVSNVPKYIVGLLEDPQWCPSSMGITADLSVTVT